MSRSPEQWREGARALIAGTLARLPDGALTGEKLWAVEFAHQDAGAPVPRRHWRAALREALDPAHAKPWAKRVEAERRRRKLGTEARPGAG